MIKTRLSDGGGNGHLAKVDRNGSVLVSTGLEDAIAIRKTWESGQFENSAASADMTVDGSSTVQNFCVRPTQTKHIFVDRVVFTMHDAQMKLDSNEIRRFGSSAAAPGLTNGLELLVSQSGQTFDLFTTSVMALSDFYRYADLGGVFGQTDGVAAGTDFLVVVVSFTNPIGLEATTNDEISINIQDDLTSMTLFEADYRGFSQEFLD